MRLKYKDQEVMVTETRNSSILRYHFQKLYYAIIIRDCNEYNSVGNKQRIDVIMTDDNLKILSFKREMHENTIVQNEEATTTILLPLNSFENLEIGTVLKIENKKEMNPKDRYRLKYEKKKDKVKT